MKSFFFYVLFHVIIVLGLSQLSLLLFLVFRFLLFQIKFYLIFSLRTACLLISEYFIRSFYRFAQTWYFACHVFRARLVTVFSLPLTRFTFVVKCLSFCFLFYENSI